MTLATDILNRAGDAPVATEVLCAHCGLVVPRGLVEPGAEHQFCCGGCRAVYEAVHACGLDSYYRLREAATAAGESTKPASPSGGGFDSFDSPTFHKLYVEPTEDGRLSTDLVLEGVTCAACVWLIERLPRVLDGVIEARLNLREATVRITWDPQQVALSRIARTLDRFGYTPHAARAQQAREFHQRETRRRLIHLGVAGAITGNTMLLALALYAGRGAQMEEQYRMFFRWISAVLASVSLAWPGSVFFRGAWAAIRTRTSNLDVPIALALLAGGVAGLVNVVLNRGEIYFDSLTVLIFLLLVGRFIQYRQQRRADDAVGLLFSLIPSTCHIIRSGQVLDAPVEALQIGDLAEVRPGELFPADGSVEQGRSSVNQALLTGESMPVSVSAGSLVHAGSQNVASTLQVRVNKVGLDTRLAQLVRLIEQGVQAKPPIVQFADRVGKWFVLGVSILAAGVFAYWSRISLPAAIDHTVAVLIVTCPCVLGLTTPLTIAIAIGRLARRDILVKSGAALERLSRGGELLLDKTGTITAGQLQLLGFTGDDSLKPAVAALEAKSNHPVGRALHQAMSDGAFDATFEDLVEAGDGGVSGRVNGSTLAVGSPRYVRAHAIEIPQEIVLKISEFERSGATAVVVAIDGRAVAVAALGDSIRADSAASIASLRQFNWNSSILSGDTQQVVTSVAAAVEVPPARALGGMSPEEKLAQVQARRTSREPIVMVGDGVNDSAALAAADVGIAVHGGAEASLAAADIYIARPGLSPLVELVSISRMTMRTIRRNLVLSLGYNVIAGSLAACGYMSPLIAAILMPLSSVTVLSLAVASIGRSGRHASWK